MTTMATTVLALSDRVNEIVLPGDNFSKPDKDIRYGSGDKHRSAGARASFIVGPGLREEGDIITAINPGVLRLDDTVYWVDSHRKRYVAARGDNVLGVVVSKAGDIYRIDIGTSELASLSYLAFEGATKRNRPNVKIGDLVYAKVLVASKDVEPELVCIDGKGRTCGLGVQSGGYVFKTSVSLALRLLSPDCVLLSLLGKITQYEVIVGHNGRILVKGRSIKETLDLADAISSVECRNNDQIKTMVKRLSNSLAGF